MSNDQHELSLHPDHLTDLLNSGLLPTTILEAKLYSVTPADISKKLNNHFPNVKSLLSFPYLGDGDFERYKLFPAQRTNNGTVKYYQQADTPSRLYLPPGAREKLQDLSADLYITEGEKKTLKAAQEGLACIGLGGLWNWSDGNEEKGLIPDFDLIKLKGRTVFLVPDNDWREPDRHGNRKNLHQAVYELAYLLIDRGAKVYVVELPQGPEKGIDDYLCHHSVEEFNSLPRVTVRKQIVTELIEGAEVDRLSEIVKRIAGLPETERAVHIGSLSKKLDIPKSAIKKDVKVRIQSQAGTSEDKAVPSAYFPGLVDICLNKGGEIVFLTNHGGVLNASPVQLVNGSLYEPPTLNKIPFLIPRLDEVMEWISKDSDEILFNDLLTHLKKFSFIQDEQFLFTALFVLATYLQDHPSIQYFPMLLFWSVPERGKSRTGKVAAYCSFRGIHTVDLREANLFRYSQDLRVTLFIDSMDLWKKAERNGCEDILLLRYEKGAKVARVLYPEKGPFNDMVYFDVYGPTILATNEAVHHILDTRCIPVSMPNKPANYEDPTPEGSRHLRERLTAFRARMMTCRLPAVEPIPGIGGRLWDISKPLFQVCQIVCPSRLDTLAGAILNVGLERIQDKGETLEGEILLKIKETSPNGDLNWSVPLQEIVDKLNEKRSKDYQLSGRYVGQKVKSLGLIKHRQNDGWKIDLTRTAFEMLLLQFGLKNIPTTE